MSIAHRILKLRGKEDVNRMHEEVAKLYEKLTVLKFAKENFEEEMPTIGADSSFFELLNQAFNNKVTDTIEVEDKVYTNMDEIEDDDIMEPVMEKIKDIVAQIPQEAQRVLPRSFADTSFDRQGSAVSDQVDTDRLADLGPCNLPSKLNRRSDWGVVPVSDDVTNTDVSRPSRRPRVGCP